MAAIPIGSATLTVSITAPPPPDPPGAPTVTVGERTPNSIELLWEPPEDDGGAAITGYNIYAAPTAGGLELSLIATSGAVSAYTVNGLLPLTEYRFAVEAINAGGLTSDPSVEVLATTFAIADPPEAASLYVTRYDDVSISVTWPQPTSELPITSYVMLLAVTGEELVPVATLNYAAGAYTFQGLDPGTSYDIAVQAISAAGPGAVSESETVVTAATSFDPPDTPTLLLGSTVTDVAVSVKWGRPADGGDPITEYALYSGPHGGSLSLAASVDDETFGYTFTGLTAGTAYDFALVAINSAGSSAQSELLTVTTDDVPDAPEVTADSRGETYLRVEWAPPLPNGSPLTGFKVYLAPHGDPAALVDTIAGMVGSYTFTGLDPDTSYDIWLRATNAVGDSELSTVLTYSTLEPFVSESGATFHPPPPLPEPPPRYMRAALWDQTRTQIIRELPEAKKNHTEIVREEVGGGHFTMNIASDALADIRDGGGRIVQVQSWNDETLSYADAYQWRLDDSPLTVVSTHQGQRVIIPAGRGVESDFETSQVDPAGGPGQIPWGDVRSFGWQAIELDDSGSPWTAPHVRSIQALKTGLPPYGLAGKPYGWPNPLSPWLWGRAPINGQDAPGFSYFRYRFTTYRDLDITFYITADDLFVAALDGVDIIDFQTDKGDAAGSTYWRKLKIKAGNHVFCARVENETRPGIAENCGLLNMCATYGISPEPTTPWRTLDTQRFLFTTAGWSAPDTIGAPHPQGWRALAYPETAPGMPPGAIMLVLMLEAHARGELAGWSVSFNAATDSAGNPWPEHVREFQPRVGATYLDVLNQMVEQGYIHWWVSRGSLTLNIVAANHTFPTPGAVFEEGVNIVDLTHNDRWSVGREKILARTENGWVRRGSGPRQAVLTIPDWDDEGKINDYLDKQIARTQADQSTIALAFSPRSAAVTPIVGVNLFDHVEIPGRVGGTVTPQVSKIVLDEAEVGPPASKVELESAARSAEALMAKVQDRTAPGAFNGRAASIAPYAKSQPEGGELRLVEVKFNLAGRAEYADTNAISDGLTYADSGDERPSGRYKLQRCKLSAATQQIGEPAYEGYTTVHLVYNGNIGMTLTLGPGETEVDDFFGSGYADPRHADLNPFPNWFLETGPFDAMQVYLARPGTHRNLLFTVWGYEVP